MKHPPLKRITSHAVVMPRQNIDTDQIIPARFLKGTSREGLGQHLFCDLRKGADGAPRPDFELNAPAAQGAQVLIAGNNFGCGSSREHAPWALLDYGFRAVISTEIADIFRNNALKNGLLPLVIGANLHARLLRGEGNPLTIDLDAQVLSLADGTQEAFVVEPFARYRLLQGLDELDFLLQQDGAIATYEESH